MLGRKTLKTLQGLLLVLLSLAMLSGTASLATAAGSSTVEKPKDWNQDEWKRWQNLSIKEKEPFIAAGIAEIAQEKCKDRLYKTTLGKNEGCEEFTRKALGPIYALTDKILEGKDPGMLWCSSLSAQGASKLVVYQCTSGALNNLIAAFVKGVVAVKQAMDAQLVDGVVKVVQFIADPKTALDNLANDFKSQSVEGTKQVLNSLTSVTGIDATSKDFRAIWAAFSGIGVVVMVGMLIMLFKRYGEGKVSDDSFGTSMMYYLPGGFLLAIFGPALIGVAQGWSNGLNDGATGWAASSINDFITVIAGFGAMESTGWFGSVLAIILFGILMLGAFGLLIFLLLSPYFMGFAGLAIAILWGLALVPSLRPRLVKVGSVLIMMIFMKPIVFVLIGGVFSLIAATPAFKEGTDDVMVNVGSLAATGILMLLLTFSPVLLFKFMPILDAEDVPSAGGGALLAGGAAGAVAGGVGRSFSNLQQGARARRSAAADGGRGTASQSGWGGAGASTGSSSSTGPGTGAGSGSGSGGASTGGRSRGGSPTQGSRAGGGVAPSGGSALASEPAGSSVGGGSGGFASSSSSGSGGAPAVSGGSRTGRGSSSGAGGRGAGSRLASLATTPIKSGMVGALWAGRESARTARRAAADYGDMPSSWGSFKGAPHSKEQE